ncbi:MAG: hypothetical protein M5U34_42550 [Chloroflexi bacterium]|nr:hypothetical protein [Chloroflexota bacterium]
MVANTLQIRHWIPDLVYGKEVCLTVLPIIHSYGLINAMSLPIALGGTVVLSPVFDVEEVLTFIRDYRVSIFPVCRPCTPPSTISLGRGIMV